MKIYFGSAITYGRQYLENSRLIVATLEKLGHEVISKHVVDPELKVGDGLEPGELYRRETANIDQADVMVAEVTQPSWGTAFLIEHALKGGKPVLALFYKDNGQNLPMMIEGHPDLYKEYYSEDNIRPVLRRFCRFVKEKKLKQKGKLIVIDGSDGSGKSTQAQKLLNYLTQSKINHKYIDFPRYYTSFHGQMVGRFLKGDFGALHEVNPYLVSYIYALDRLAAKEEILDWLQEGSLVVANRYTTSSMAFQSVRVPKNKQDEFINWLYELEYKQNRLPKEDIVIYLYVPVKVSQALLVKKEGIKSRRYLGKQKKDINESNIAYQQKVTAMYLRLARKYQHWHVINCVDADNRILSITAIHEKILALLQKEQII